VFYGTNRLLAQVIRARAATILIASSEKADDI
jgi:hypothetical protein